MDLVGGDKPRPGRALGLHQHLGQQLLPAGRLVRRRRLVARAEPPHEAVRAARCLAVAIVPVVVLAQPGTVDRARRDGRLYVAVRLTSWPAGCWILGALAVAGGALVVALVATPARRHGQRPAGQRQVQRRTRRSSSNGALDGLAESPLIGFGSTRNTIGGRNSIAVGESADCERCGNFTVGGNGQLWQLLFAHGAARHRRLPGLLRRTACGGSGATAAPIGIAGSAAIVSRRSPRCSGTTRWSPRWPSCSWPTRCSGATTVDGCDGDAA